DRQPLAQLLERGAPQLRVGVARAAQLELRVRPGVEVGRRLRSPQLCEEAVARPFDRLPVDVAVLCGPALLEHALVDLDRVDAGRLGAAALPLEVVLERR